MSTGRREGLDDQRDHAKLKQFRAVATRYDKRDFVYQDTVDVGLDPDLATRPGSMIDGARLASAVWSEVMETRN